MTDDQQNTDPVNRPHVKQPKHRAATPRTHSPKRAKEAGTARASHAASSAQTANGATNRRAPRRTKEAPQKQREPRSAAQSARQERNARRNTNAQARGQKEKNQAADASTRSKPKLSLPQISIPQISKPISTGPVKARNTGSMRPSDTGSMKARNTGSLKPSDTGSMKARNTGSLKPQNTGSLKPHITGALAATSPAEIADKLRNSDNVRSAAGHVIDFGSRLFARAPRLMLAIVIVLAVFLVGNIALGVDGIIHNNRIMPNVSIGGIDVSDMTREEAMQAVADVYEPIVHKAPVYVYANDAAREAKATNTTTSDLESVAEEKAKTVVWTADMDSLAATIDYETIADEAMGQGRHGLLDRLTLGSGTRDLDVLIALNADAVENLAADIDRAIGKPYLNCNVAVSEGVAAVTSGYDGDKVDREWFSDQLTSYLLQDSDDDRAFTAKTVFTPVRIDDDNAQKTVDAINGAIGWGVRLVCDEQSWTISASELGDMITTSIKKRDNNDDYYLAPALDEASVKKTLLKHVSADFGDESARIGFEQTDDGSIVIHAHSVGEMPQVTEAVTHLDDLLFGAFRSHGEIAKLKEAPSVEVTMATIPDTISFDDALAYGVISEIQSFTTEYTSRATARNTNIHLASDMLNNSIISANGGTWSFNDITGQRTEEKGFVTAGVVQGNMHDEDVGGGICQVATTIFNTVFEAGYPVLERRNHSLYMSAYPAGRDAAVSWGSPNLRWENDTSSDILMKMSYTDDTVTCTLYGIDPGYQVSSETGKWVAGAEYQTIYQNDSKMPSGTQYVKSGGQNGRSITVTRTVKDAAGNVLHEDTFSSNYVASNRIIVRGTG